MLKLNYSGFDLEAGTDEAGRGCLAGPVVAAAVILPKDFSHPFLNDSKQLSEKKRKELKTNKATIIILVISTNESDKLFEYTLENNAIITKNK